MRDGARPVESLRERVLRDLKEVGLPRTWRRDLHEIYRFYLDDESRERLHAMGGGKRAFWLIPWLLKSLLLKLSPARRLMLLASLVLGMAGEWSFQIGRVTTHLNLGTWGFLLLFAVLMLELKDKLLAHEEIAVARQVQLALLPLADPEFEGWSLWSFTRPANDVGGDLVDYLPLDGRLGVALGDVAGKGLGAALLMAKLQATLRAFASGCSSLGELGGHLNVSFLRGGPANRFATLFYFEIERSSGRLRFLNAGHNPALHVRAGPGASSAISPGSGASSASSAGSGLLESSSYPLGIVAEAAYAEGAVELGPGETVIVYSDGLVEARGPTGEEYGLDRLRSLAERSRSLSPAETGARILEEMDRFLSGERAHDDVSLVVVQRVGEPVDPASVMQQE